MQSKAQTVDQYISELPEDRRPAVEAVRRLVLDNLPDGYEEAMNWGMITYQVPLSRYPDTYNKQPLAYVSLASQKNHIALYMMCLYDGSSAEQDFREEWGKSGKKLDMGKSCIRFRDVGELETELLGKTIRSLSPDEYIELYESSRRK